MDSERNEESGKFINQYPREAFLDGVENIKTATTQRVADHVGCSYDLAYRRLGELAEEGDIVCEEIGGSFVWSIPSRE